MTTPPAGPALAEVSDLATWLEREIPEDNARALALLAAASNLVRSVARHLEWVPGDGPNQVPPEVRDIVVQAAARAWRRRDGEIAKSTGPFSVQYQAADAAGLYLTRADQSALARHRPGTTSGLRTIGTTRGEPGCDTVYLPVAGPGDPVPYYAGGDVADDIAAQGLPGGDPAP